MFVPNVATIPVHSCGSTTFTITSDYSPLESSLRPQAPTFRPTGVTMQSDFISSIDESETDDGSDEFYDDDTCPDSLCPNRYVPPDSSKRLPPFAVTELAAASSADYAPSTWREKFADNPAALDYIERSIAKRPLKIAVFDKYLAGYWDLDHIKHLLTHGIKLIHFGHEPIPYVSTNYKSALILPKYVDVELESQMEENRILDITLLGIVAMFVHAIGALYRRDTDDVRLLHDYSSPIGRSLNEAIYYAKFSWHNFYTLADLVTRGCWIARTDIRWYYRHFPIDPAHWEYTLFGWSFQTGVRKVFADLYLNFGQRNAPELGHRFTLAIVEILRRAGFDRVAAILDDFAICYPDRETCQSGYVFLLGILQELGFEVSKNPTKTHGAAQLVQWSGVTVDTVALTARLKEEKLVSFRAELERLSEAPKWTAFEVRSLAGSMNWAAKVCLAVKIYLWIILQRRNAVRLWPRYHRFRPVLRERQAVDFVRRALDDSRFHGVAFVFPCEPWPVRWAQTDARLPTTPDSGCVGGFVDGGFFSLSLRQCQQLFPEECPAAASDVHVWEVFAVFVLLSLFGDCFVGVHLWVDIDNPGAAASVDRQRGPSGRTDMQDLMELTVLRSIEVGCRLSSRKVVGAEIPEADALSRKWTEVFHGLLCEFAAGKGCAKTPYRFVLADAGR